ncbi:MAG: hypothetical protein ACI39E_08075 [Acutalibacteraceae bacterium]
MNYIHNCVINRHNVWKCPFSIVILTILGISVDKSRTLMTLYTTRTVGAKRRVKAGDFVSPFSVFRRTASQGANRQIGLTAVCRNGQGDPIPVI